MQQNICAKLNFKKTINNKGQTLIEYCFVSLLIIISIIGTYNLFKNAIRSYFNRVTVIIASPGP